MVLQLVRATLSKQRTSVPLVNEGSHPISGRSDEAPSEGESRSSLGLFHFEITFAWSRNTSSIVGFAPP